MELEVKVFMEKNLRMKISNQDILVEVFFQWLMLVRILMEVSSLLILRKLLILMVLLIYNF